MWRENSVPGFSREQKTKISAVLCSVHDRSMFPVRHQWPATPCTRPVPKLMGWEVLGSHLTTGSNPEWERERERNVVFNDTHFIYGYMASDIWLRTILIVRKETRCRHIGYSFRLTARVLLYALSHRQDSTYHGLCYTSRGALAGTRNSSMGPPHEGSIRRPIAL